MTGASKNSYKLTNKQSLATTIFLPCSWFALAGCGIVWLLISFFAPLFPFGIFPSLATDWGIIFFQFIVANPRDVWHYVGVGRNHYLKNRMKTYLITVSAPGFQSVEMRVKAKSLVTAKKSSWMATRQWIDLNNQSYSNVIWTTTIVKI